MDLYGCPFKYAGISSTNFGKLGPDVKRTLNEYSDIPLLDITESDIQNDDVIKVLSDSAHDYNPTFYKYTDTEPSEEEVYVPAKDEGYWVFMGVAVSPEYSPAQYDDPAIVEYDGRTLIIASVDSDVFNELQSETEFQTVFNNLINSNMIVGESFADSTISFDIDIVTEDFAPLSNYDLKNIQKWLFSKYNYEKLYSEAQGSTNSNVYINCKFINPIKIEGNGGVIGYTATIMSDSSFLWEDQNIQVLDLNIPTEESMATGTVVVDSDMPDYIYPTVSIEIGNVGGDIYIANSTDDTSRFTKFEDVSPNVTIVMDGNNNMISDNYYEKFADRNFIRLLDGNNLFTINGNVKSLTFTFNNRKFL